MDAVRVLGGRYRLVERLGSGGMSVVWRAYDEVLGRQVAVKVLHPGGLSDAGSRARIRAEAQQAARLAHPYITSVHDYGESPMDDDECVPFVVMELVNGPTLADRIAEGPVAVPDALRICAQVAAALAAAHARGVVHRDIKPANIILSASGAKVLDFGIAAVAGEPDLAPTDGEVWGTPAYLAPERLEDGVVASASDVYALGLLLYRLLAGSLPWQAETVTQMISAHLYVEPAPLPYLPDVHGTVREICARCLAKDPAERPQAGEVARLLAAASGRQSRSAGTAGGPDRHIDTRLVPVRRPGVVAPIGVPADESGGPPADESGPPADGSGPPADESGSPADESGGPATADDAAEADAAEDSAAADERPAAAGAAVEIRPAGSSVGAVAVPRGRPGGRRPRRRLALSAAAMLIGVGMVAGFCAYPDSPGGAPGAGPSRQPSVGAEASGGTPDVTPDPATAGSAGAPDTPIQPGAVGGNPGVGQSGVGQSGVGQPAGPGGSAAGVPGPTPSAVERTIGTVAGTVRVRCVGPTAEIIGWDLLPGVALADVNRGPGPETGIVLNALVAEVRLVVRCRDGVPEHTLL